MKDLYVSSSRGQVKIQQMAFVLVAIMIFLAIVTLFYLTIRSASLQEDVEILRESKAKELVRMAASWPELYWRDCASCIDMDKAFILKETQAYNEFWDVPFLQIEKIYPEVEKIECNRQNYPECNKLTLIEEERYITETSFIALCRHSEKGEICELGKIHLGFRGVNE